MGKIERVIRDGKGKAGRQETKKEKAENKREGE